MNILILAALRSELRPLLEKYKPEVFYKDSAILISNVKLRRGEVFFGVTGVGRKNVIKFFETYAKLNVNADVIVSTGYAGAMNYGFVPGDTALAGYIYPARAVMAPKPQEIARNVPERIKPVDLRVAVRHRDVVSLCVGEVVSRDAKRELKRFYKIADIVDMESLEVRAFCSGRGVQFMLLRSISDEYGFVFPDLRYVTCPWRAINWGRFALYVLRNPVNLYRVVKMRRNAKLASRTLCEALEGLISGNFA